MKELSKAITAFIPEPTLPLPDELVETIAAYLRRHPKYDDAAADRLQEELLSIFDKHAKGNPAASGQPRTAMPSRRVSWSSMTRMRAMGAHPNAFWHPGSKWAQCAAHDRLRRSAAEEMSRRIRSDCCAHKYGS